MRATLLLADTRRWPRASSTSTAAAGLSSGRSRCRSPSPCTSRRLNQPHAESGVEFVVTWPCGQSATKKLRRKASALSPSSREAAHETPDGSLDGHLDRAGGQADPASQGTACMGKPASVGDTHPPCGSTTRHGDRGTRGCRAGDRTRSSEALRPGRSSPVAPAQEGPGNGVLCSAPTRT